MVLAETPEFQAPLSAFLKNPPPERFAVDPVTMVAVITAALVVLQTHVKIKRNEAGKTTFLIEKKPTSEALLKPLVKKLLGIIQ